MMTSSRQVPTQNTRTDSGLLRENQKIKRAYESRKGCDLICSQRLLCIGDSLFTLLVINATENILTLLYNELGAETKCNV